MSLQVTASSYMVADYDTPGRGIFLHTRTHTALLEFVRDYPGEQVPER